MRRAWCCALLFGCQPAAPPPVVPVAPPVEVPPAPPPPAAPEVRIGEWVRAWEAKTGGWNHAVVVTPREVVALADAAHVLARKDGSLIRRVDLPSGALDGESGFVAGGNVVVLAADGVYELRLADFAHRKIASFSPGNGFEDRPRRAAHNATRAAIADDNGRIVEYDIAGWKEVARHELGAGKRIEGLAYAADGRLAAAWRDGQVELVADPAGARPGPIAGFKKSSGGLAFSPDGQHLFGEVEYFHGAEVAIADGFARGDVKLSSWLTLSRYLDDKHVASTGAHGLAVFSLDPPGETTLDGDAGEGLGVADDGSFVCSGGRSDRIVCFARVK